MSLDQNFSLGAPFYTCNTPRPPINTQIDRYTINYLLGNPTLFSFIYICTDNDDNTEKVIKFIKFQEKQISMIVNEISTMTMLNHPNIIQIENYFRFDAYACVVIPYTKHRSLFWFLVRFYPTGMPEDLSCIFFEQMLKAVDHIHSIGVWHRDIKPANFLLFDNDNQNDETKMNVVLCDFGIAKYFAPGEKSSEYYGTSEYLAPEIVKRNKYDNKIDIWALGISLFMMLTGRFPFPSSAAPYECFEHIKNGRLNFGMLEELDVTNNAIDLLKRMCEVDPMKRITAKEALNHIWIKEGTREKTESESLISAALGTHKNYPSINQT